MMRIILILPTTIYDQDHLDPTCHYCAVSCSMRSITTTGVLSLGPRGLKPLEPSGPLGWRVTVTWGRRCEMVCRCSKYRVVDPFCQPQI